MAMAKSDHINRMFRAFSDRTRLRILHLLQDGELCVGDIVEILRAPQPTVSRHLSYLHRAGLVIKRREGFWSFYSLAPAKNDFHKRLIDCLGSCFAEVPELAADAKRKKRIKESGSCCPR